MNFDDLNKESLGLQKIPFPVIESIVLNDDDGISLDMRWSIYAPVTNGKDIFQNYNDILTISAVIMTRDTTEETNKALESSKIKVKGAFLDFGQMNLGTSYEVYGGFYWINNKLLESNRFGSPYSFKPEDATMIPSPEFGQIRKYQFSQTFKNLKMTEVINPKKPILAPNNIRVLADDRIINLNGFIEISADFSKATLPFPVGKSRLTYAFPFTIAENGEINFSYLAPLTNQQEIWLGPIEAGTDEDGEVIIRKLPVRFEDPDLQLVRVQDPTAVSSFVGVKTGGYFQLDLDKKTLEQVNYTKNFSTNLADYFSSKKLDKINSPVSPVWCWGTNKKNSVNFAFEFDIKKFMNGDAFQYSGMGINVYEDNIKSIRISRRKIAKNIEEKFTEDFLEKEVVTIHDFIIKQAIIDGAAYFTDKKINYTIYRADDSNLKLLFVMQDNEVENKYEYKYSVKVIYDSKRLTALNNYFDMLQPLIAKFESLESVIFYNQFYDSDYDRMTDKFKMQYKKLFNDLADAFQAYLQYLGEVTHPPKPNKETKKFDNTFTAFMTLIDVDTILPSTYFILKDVLRESIEQGRKFLRDPSLNKKPKNKDSKPPKAPEKIYELSGEVKVEGYNNISLNYLEKGTPTQYFITPEIATPQLENLFILEYAKYNGSEKGFKEKPFTRKTYTPITINFNNQVIETLDDDNLFNPPENQNITGILLSGINKSSVDYTQNTAKKAPSQLLQALDIANISVIDSTNSGKFQNTDNLSKMSFTDFFSNGDPFSKNDQYKSVYTKKKENYQDLQNLTSQYSLVNAVGLSTILDAFQKMITTQGVTSTNRFDLPPVLYALKIAADQETVSPYFEKLKAHIANVLNVVGGSTDEIDNFEQSFFALMVFANVVQIEILQNGEWIPYTGVSGIKGTYVLARFVLLKDDLVNHIPHLGVSIINQYFVLDTGKISGLTLFELPDNKNPEKPPQKVLVPKTDAAKVKPAVKIKFATPVGLDAEKDALGALSLLGQIDNKKTRDITKTIPPPLKRTPQVSLQMARTESTSITRTGQPSPEATTTRATSALDRTGGIATEKQPVGKRTGVVKLEPTTEIKTESVQPPTPAAAQASPRGIVKTYNVDRSLKNKRTGSGRNR